MPTSDYPFRMVGRVPVVTGPAEIDVTNAGELRAILVDWQSRGHTTVAVDLTGTQFCDSTGLRELVRAHKRTGADGGGLRLVVPAEGAVVRTLAVSGLDQIIPCFATLRQALAQVPATIIRPPRRGSAPEPASPSASPAAQEREHDGRAADSRGCEQCGAVFVPLREHARFCRVDCRAAWNREHLGDPAVEASALAWSIVAMSEATGRLTAAKAWEQEEAFALIGEAVWWITMIDATLVRHHPGPYDRGMAARTPAGRRLIVETLAGLRFVRNQIGRGVWLGEALDLGTGTRRILHWTWKPIGEPAPGSLAPRAQAWELARYRAYQARLVGCTVGKTFGPAVSFLTLTGADAAAITDPSSLS